MYCTVDNHNYIHMSHMCRRSFRFELQLNRYWQNINFSQNWPKFHIYTKVVIFQVYLHFLGQLLHPYGRDMSGILFFIFASCEPLKGIQRALRICASLWAMSLISFLKQNLQRLIDNVTIHFNQSIISHQYYMQYFCTHVDFKTSHTLGMSHNNYW